MHDSKVPSATYERLIGKSSRFDDFRVELIQVVLKTGHGLGFGFDDMLWWCALSIVEFFADMANCDGLDRGFAPHARDVGKSFLLLFREIGFIFSAGLF